MLLLAGFCMLPTGEAGIATKTPTNGSSNPNSAPPPVSSYAVLPIKSYSNVTGEFDYVIGQSNSGYVVFGLWDDWNLPENFYRWNGGTLEQLQGNVGGEDWTLFAIGVNESGVTVGQDNSTESIYWPVGQQTPQVLISFPSVSRRTYDSNNLSSGLSFGSDPLYTFQMSAGGAAEAITDDGVIYGRSLFWVTHPYTIDLAGCECDILNPVTSNGCKWATTTSAPQFLIGLSASDFSLTTFTYQYTAENGAPVFFTAYQFMTGQTKSTNEVRMTRGGVVAGTITKPNFNWGYFIGTDPAASPEIPLQFYDLNSLGQMLGEKLDANNHRTGVYQIYDGKAAAYVPLPVPQSAVPFSFNAKGQFLGTPNGTALWTVDASGTATSNDLNQLIGSQTGDNSWVITKAFRIDDNGCITVTAHHPSDTTTDYLAMLVPMQIERRIADQTNYAPISTASPYPQNVVVAGQLMDLELVQSGTSLPITNIQWVIDGTTFKSYVANNSAGTLTQLASTDTANQTVQFFWADAGTKNVVCKFNIGSAQAQVSYKFTVVAPTAVSLTRPVTRGTVAIVSSGYYIDDPTTPALTSSQTGSGGINYTYTYTPISSTNTSYDVEMQVFQLITPGRSYQDATTQQIKNWTLNRQVVSVLDGGAIPYPSNPHSSTTLNARDTPSTTLVSSDSYFKVANETFDVWLMYRSLQGKSGSPVDTTSESAIDSTVSSAWVPLSHFTWSWSGEADRSGTNWVLKPGSDSSPQPTAEQPTSVQPQWTANSHNLDWTQ